MATIQPHGGATALPSWPAEGRDYALLPGSGSSAWRLVLPPGPACQGQWSVSAWLARPEGARSFIPEATSRHPKCANPGPGLARLPRETPEGKEKAGDQPG